MDLKRQLTRPRWWVLSTVICVAAATLLVPRLAEPSGEGETIAQPPLVTVIFDTSASMQWTENDGEYPVLDPNEVEPEDEFNPEAHLPTWRHGAPLNLPGSSRFGQGRPVDQLYSDMEHMLPDWMLDAGTVQLSELGDQSIETVGPCMVWHAQESDSEACSDYHRPSSCALDDPGAPDSLPDDCHYDSFGDMRDRLQDMMQSEALRLSEDANTPRHIAVKQILTGRMSLGDVSAAGPGCWFIPRARGALQEEQICCDADGQSGRCDLDGDPDPGPFNTYVDYDEPIPHFQEVYDSQEPGMLDGLSRQAIFSVATFDGYRGDGTERTIAPGQDEETWDFPTTDIMDGNSYPNDRDWDVNGTHCADGSGEECYNMGLFRVVGPTSLDGISDADRVRMSRYVQEAILDAGFLMNESPDDATELGRELETEDGTSAQLDRESVFDYPVGKQPMAQASPFGAVFHDLHQFHIHGQHDGMDDDDTNPVVGAVSEDPYRRCRARHAVFMTDGMVEPEAPGGAGDELGSEVLKGGGFGYDPAQYPYNPGEKAIEEMLSAIDTEVGGFDDPRYQPRVHVMGVSVVGAHAEDHEASEASRELRKRALDKMGAMAEAGGTCAQAYLGDARLEDDEGNCEDGDGNELDWCLMRQDYGGSDGTGYSYRDPDGNDIDCEHPALVLTKSDPGAYEDAFGLIFNHIAGTSGVEARTRPAVTNHIDMGDETMGQFRFFSGFEIEGDNRNWKGLLQRRLLQCNDGEVEDDGDPLALHEDLNRLMLTVEDAGDDTSELEELLDDETLDSDRRRLFTSAPQFLSRDHDMEMDGPFGDVAGTYFSTTYALQEASNEEFEGDDSDVDSRVPFTVENLTETIEQSFWKHDEEDQYDNWYADYWGVNDEQELQRLVDAYRGRTPERMDRVLGAIYSSDPVAVGPPSLDLPIDSYRQFRRDQKDRLTMLYTTTVDGQLRALHAGEPEVVARNMDGNDTDFNSDASVQREAWAYLPQLLHRRLVPFRDYTAPDGLMDGTPVVEDIRLCSRSANGYSSNKRVCPDEEISAGEQWRTVLVQGMGVAGSGYFAMDITRTGSSDELPDPIPMWEFGPQWEMLQAHFIDNPSRLGDADDLGLNSESDCQKHLDETPIEFREQIIDDERQLSFLGATVGEPALGLVNMVVDEEADHPVQRPVAVFGAGSSANVQPTEPFSNTSLPDSCINRLTGRAIYVVDLQSGEMIRRFVAADNVDEFGGGVSEGELFPADITGTPVLSGASPADLSTRGFIGDEEGRMYRIDFSHSDPEEWKVSLFYDPAEDSEDLLGLGNDFEPGPAAYRPAVTVRGSDRNLVLVYGLADRGDSGGGGTRQGVIALQESYTYDENDGEFIVVAEPLWGEGFGTNILHERLTGPPMIFNNDVYFTTYYEEIDDEDQNQVGDRCGSGGSRIWRLAYQGDPECDLTEGACDSYGTWADDISNDMDNRFIDQPTVIRGVEITMGPACERQTGDALGSATGQAQPQLIAQTAGDPSIGPDDDGAAATSVGQFEEIAIDLDAPETQSVPLSWSVIEQ